MGDDNAQDGGERDLFGDRELLDTGQDDEGAVGQGDAEGLVAKGEFGEGGWVEQDYEAASRGPG